MFVSVFGQDGFIFKTSYVISYCHADVDLLVQFLEKFTSSIMKNENEILF